MDTTFVPATQDSALLMESAITKTATFAGTTFDQGVNFGPGGCGMPIGVVVQATAVDRTTGDETYAFKVQESSDNATWTDASVTVNITAASVFTVPSFVSKRYTRLSTTLGGTTPSVTYSAWANPLIF